MSFLVDIELRRALERDGLMIQAVLPQAVQAGSVDLCLGAIEDDNWLLESHDFRLASTLEWIEMPAGMAGVLFFRSSAGRVGLGGPNAVWVDPGFKGQITVELFNYSRQPILLARGQSICQLVILRGGRPSGQPYGSTERSRYQFQNGPTKARPR